MSDHEDKAENEKESAAEHGDSPPRASSGVFSILLPADPAVWNEARKLVSDLNLRVEDLAACSSQDPAIVLELLKVANAMFFSGGKGPITSIKTAIVRLGSELIIELLEKMKDREIFDDPRASHWYDIHRSRCRRAAIISRLLSETLARTLSDDCQAISLFLFIGELLAVMQLREVYTQLADEQARSTVLYRLAQDHRFDCESMGLAYLRRNGIPEVLATALDRDARSRQNDRAIMRPICAAAAEMIDAFDSGRWEKLSPGKPLPPKSNVRLLGISDSQYLKIYERASEYLYSSRALDEKKKSMPAVAFDSDISTLPPTPQDSSSSISLAQDIDSLIGDLTADLPEDEDLTSDFGLGDAKSKVTARSSETHLEIPEIALPSSRIEAMLTNLTNVFEQAKSSEEVLIQLLDMLVAPGPFEKSALIVVSKDRKKAVVVAARGPGIEDRQMLMLDDPLSPLAQCFSKVQSFGNRGSSNSPFGSKAYALSPIDADHESPVALYADCGPTGAITFEARRIFRLVVKLLNQKLPQVAGGIPVEI